MLFIAVHFFKSSGSTSDDYKENHMCDTGPHQSERLV